MKLKCRPEDFDVEELSDVRPTGGPFALYRLTKRSLGTPEAVDALLHRWNLPRDAVSYGGLKDKHARTAQFVTIRRGPRRDLQQDKLELAYLGQTAQPFTPQDIRANRFRIVLRDLKEADAARVAERLAEIERTGLPNYFDDQRFGSLGVSGEFIADPWCRGDYERALWLALAEPNVHDRPDERTEKETLRATWGDWTTCKARLSRSHRRSVITYLVDHPTDFRRAFALLRNDLRGLWLSAFQSRLWNDLLAARIRDVCRDDQLSTVELGGVPVPFPRGLDDDQLRTLTSLPLPLPSARLHFDEADPLLALYERTLAARGLALRELRVKYPRDSFFSKGLRAALVVGCAPRIETGPDELHANRLALTLAFDLPRGAYATILVKRATET